MNTDKRIYHVSNGSIIGLPFNINRTTISFGKEDSHINIATSSIDHICDLIFTSQSSLNATIRVFCDNLVKVNGVFVGETCDIIHDDIITIGEEEFIYTIGEIHAFWIRTSENRIKSTMEKYRNGVHPNTIQIKKMISSTTQLPNKETVLPKKQLETLTEPKILNQTVETSSHNINLKKKLLSQTSINNSSAGPNQSSLLNISPSQQIIENVRNENITLPQKLPSSISSSLGHDIIEKESKLSIFKSSGQITPEILSKSPEKTKLSASIKSSEQKTGSSTSESIVKTGQIDEKEVKDEMNNCIEEDMSEDYSSEEETNEISSSKNQIQTKRMIDDKKNKENEYKEKFKITTEIEPPTEQRKRSGSERKAPSVKKEIKISKCITDKTFYFGINKKLYNDHRKKIQAYGGIARSGYPEFGVETTQNLMDVSEKQEFLVCEEKSVGLLYPYLYCIVNNFPVINATFLIMLFNGNTSYSIHYLPVFPNKSFPAIGKDVVKPNFVDFPKQPLNFKACAEKKYKLTRNSLKHNQSLDPQKRFEQDGFEEIQNRYFVYFVKSIGAEPNTGNAARKNCYDLYDDFLQSKKPSLDTSGRRANTRSSASRVNESVLDLHWIVEMFRAKKFIDPEEHKQFMLEQTTNNFPSS
ncbi:FHA domain-containing protein [Entamoeba marina]